MRNYVRSLFLIFAVLLAVFNTQCYAQANQGANGQVCHGSYEPAKALAKAATEIVHIFGIGDSNQVHQGNGWDRGWRYALFNMSTPARQWSTGWVSGRTGTAAMGYHSAPSLHQMSESFYATDHETYKGDGTNIGPLSIADGSSANTSLPNGVVILETHPQITEGMQWQGIYGTFPNDGTYTGAGTFRPRGRRNSSPWSPTFNAPSVINTKVNAAGVYGVELATLDLPANATRDYRLVGGWKCPGGSSVQGPFFSPANRIIFNEQNSGFSYTTWLYQGGQPTRTAANSVLSTQDGFFAEIVGRSRQDSIAAGQTPKIIVMICHGFNDRNDGGPSVGPAVVADGDSLEAFVDNTQAIIDEWERLYNTVNGWPLAELTFVIMPSHVSSYPDDAEIHTYRMGAIRYATSRDRVLAIDLNALHSYSSYTANSNAWQYNGSDAIHLSATGHQEVSLAAANAMLDYASTEPTGGSGAPRISISGGPIEIFVEE